MKVSSDCNKASTSFAILNGKMMFAQELPVRPREVGGPMSPFSPSSPVNYSSTDVTTPSSPLKMEPPYFNPQSPLTMKMEPLSPSFSRRITMEWQPSPSASSVDSMPPHSPMSAFGVSLSSPLSPSSTVTLSPSTKIGRDDLSPASSIISSGFGADPVEKKKKGSNSRQTDELCLVCGDRASGYHYNALTCEGCKGFFRRSITKNAVYSCKYGQNCEMDMYMRRKCQLCRFKKCLNMGMKPECVTQSIDCTPNSSGVVPENTCLQKREQKKAREKDKSIKSEPLTPLSGDALQSAEAFPLPPSLKVNCGKIELTKEHQELISRLIVYQDYYECPPEVNDFVPSKASDEEKSVQILEMTKLTTDLIIKFALTAPGFLSLPVPDQVTLLKTCNAELMTLRASRRYDPETDSIVFANNVPCTRDFYLSAGIKPATTVALFDFCRKMAAMKVDNAEYALLSGIALFSDRPQLKERKKAEIIQYLYVETLYAYVINKWSSKSGTMIAKLLNVLTQLRTLGNNNNEQCEYYHQKGKKIPEIMREMLDMQKR